MLRIQSPPQGGSDNDYKQWALSVPGVTRVWVQPKTPDAGSVTVRFAMDGSRTDGLPLPADVASVKAYIEAPGRRPVTANVVVVAPTVQAINITITGLTPDTAAIRAAVQAELTDALLANGSPGGTIRLSWLYEAVSRASGERYHRVTVPSADVVLAAGALPKLGTVTFV